MAPPAWSDSGAAADAGDAADPSAVERIPLAAVPTGACIAVAGGQVLLSRIDAGVVAYRNACLHRGASMVDGVVRGGTLTCPAHLWRYRLVDGSCVTGPGQLTPVPVSVDGDRVEVVVPDPSGADEGPAHGDAASAMRARLLEHARTWTRDG